MRTHAWMVVAACLSLAVLGGESFFGSNVHWHAWECADGELQAIKSAGLDFVRGDIAWKQTETKPGVWDFSIWDSLLTRSHAQGIDAMLIFGGYEKRFSKPYHHQEAWNTYVRNCVEHYRDRVRFWEVINEPNIQGDFPDGTVYGKFLAETYREVKKANPAATVLTGGFAGFPFSYIEKTLTAAGPDCFDIYNFHYYTWTTYPEDLLPNRLAELKKLLKKVGADKKPIWMTETGYATGKPFNFQRLTAAVLEKIGLNRDDQTVGLLVNDEFRYYSEGVNNPRSSYFPSSRKCRELSMTELAGLDPKDVPLILLAADGRFPMDYARDLAGYVARGGSILLPATIPLYDNICKDADGHLVLRGAGDLWRRIFHIGWYTWWTKPGVPRGSKHPTRAAWLPADAVFPDRGTRCFFNADHLAPGDELIPIVTGYSEDKTFSAPIAAIYRLNSDMKGNVICYGWEGHHENTSLENQAKFVPRLNLIALGNGVEKVLWYRFRGNEIGKDAAGTRARESSREHNFGIVFKFYQPKPAHTAYAVLTRLCPAGSTHPTLSDDGTVWRSSWKRPDGTAVLAVWTINKPKDVTVTLSGKLIEACNHLGTPVAVAFQNGQCTFTVSDSVTYLVSR